MVTKFMGLLLFLAGFFLIVLAAGALLGFIQPSGLLERILMFVAGLTLCVVGYLMARDRPLPS